jgi:hypothetical protein
MKAVQICRQREKQLVNCVGAVEAPSASWKNRVGELIQAARQDERQKLVKRFVKERKTWEAVRREDRLKMLRLRKEMKQKDEKISWLTSNISQQETSLSTLKESVTNLENTLEAQANDRVQNARTMQEFARYRRPMYPQWLGFPEPVKAAEPIGVDPFQQVALEMFQQNKMEEQQKEIAFAGIECEPTSSAATTPLCTPEHKTVPDPVDSFMPDAFLD